MKKQNGSRMIHKAKNEWRNGFDSVENHLSQTFIFAFILFNNLKVFLETSSLILNEKNQKKYNIFEFIFSKVAGISQN